MAKNQDFETSTGAGGETHQRVPKDGAPLIALPIYAAALTDALDITHAPVFAKYLHARVSDRHPAL